MPEKEHFANGICLVTEEIRDVRSCSVGVWVNVGSRDEGEDVNGASHFIEHMMFKGTDRRTAHEIAEIIDGIGGQMGAFTSREYTCYHIKVAEEHLFFTLELLADIYLNSTFDPAEIEREKQVVLEEIKMYEDTPDELIHDLFSQTVYEGHPLGQAVIGTSGVIKGFDREKVVRFFSGHYTPDRTVIACAGKIRHKEVLNKTRELFGDYQAPNQDSIVQPPQIKPQLRGEERDLEQVHLCLGGKGLSYTSEDRFSLFLLNTILGGSMSSRLFEEIREKRGLAYAVYSYLNSFRDGGLFTVYVGTSQETCYETIEIILKEFARLKKERVKAKELKKAKEHFRGALLLSLEDTGARMSRLAKQEIYFQRHIGIDEILKKVDQVSPGQIQSLANSLFQQDTLAMASIGPLSPKELEGIDLSC